MDAGAALAVVAQLRPAPLEELRHPPVLLLVLEEHRLAEQVELGMRGRRARPPPAWSGAAASAEPAAISSSRPWAVVQQLPRAATTAVHQADPQRLVGVHPPAGEEQLLGPGLADQRRAAGRSRRRRPGCPTAPRAGRRRPGPCRPAGRRRTPARRHRRAPGRRRRPRSASAAPGSGRRRPRLIAASASSAAALAELGDVGATGEDARRPAGEQHQPGSRLELGADVVQRGDEVGVDRVALLRPVQRDHEPVRRSSIRSPLICSSPFPRVEALPATSCPAGQRRPSPRAAAAARTGPRTRPGGCGRCRAGRRGRPRR